MKLKNFFQRLIFSIIIGLTPMSTNCSAKNILLSTFGWICSSSLTWLEAWKYISLTSPEKVKQTLGSQDYNEEESKYIRSILEEAFNYPWQKIEIKEIKPELRIFIQKPFLCTGSVIFVNPEFYDPSSDFRSEYERKALILEAGWTICSKHIQTCAVFLTALPVITHFSLNYISDLTRKISEDNKESNQFLNKTLNLLSNVSECCITKLMVNLYMSKVFHKIQKLRREKSIQNFLKSDINSNYQING